MGGKESTIERAARLEESNITDEQERITFDPEQCGGRPCIRGMRIRVTDILEMLVGGASRAKLLKDYP